MHAQGHWLPSWNAAKAPAQATDAFRDGRRRGLAPLSLPSRIFFGVGTWAIDSRKPPAPGASVGFLLYLGVARTLALAWFPAGPSLDG
jgi:hypothetical protein